MADDIGTGTTLVGATSAWSANIRDVSWNGISREPIKSSHMGSTDWHEYISSDLTEPGQVVVEYLFDPSATAKIPPVRGATELWTLTPAGGNDTFTFTGFVVNDDRRIAFEDMMEGTMTIQLDGVGTAPTHNIT